MPPFRIFNYGRSLSQLKQTIQDEKRRIRRCHRFKLHEHTSYPPPYTTTLLSSLSNSSNIVANYYYHFGIYWYKYIYIYIYTPKHILPPKQCVQRVPIWIEIYAHILRSFVSSSIIMLYKYRRWKGQAMKPSKI